MVILMFTLFIMLSVELMLVHFHGRIFGAKVPKRVSFFFFFGGQLHGIRFSQLIISSRGVYC